MAKKVLVINGSYRRGGAVSLALAEAAAAARLAGAEVEEIFLLDAPVEFCRNCRSCTQEPGEKRGGCVIRDGMAALLDSIDRADSLVVGSPVNFYNLTAVTRRFMERLIPYGFWPWGAAAPKMRVKDRGKRAYFVSASAAPSLLARLAFREAFGALKAIASTVGARPSGSMHIGLAGGSPDYSLTPGEKRRAAELGRLAAGL